jgi:UDP-N-acetylglucosamine 3-dehydrogenase
MASPAPLRLGVVGCGAFGCRHGDAWLRVPNAKLVAVFDIVSQRAVALAHRCGAKVVRNIAELADVVQCVSIAVDPGRHVEVAEECLARNLHVLLEKPFGTTVDAALRLARLADDRGRVLQAGYVEHFNPAYRHAVAIVGKARFMKARRVSPPRGDQPLDVVSDLMCHDIEHALELSGILAAPSVSSGGRSTASSSHVILSFLNGFVAKLETRHCSRHRERTLMIEGETASTAVDLLTGHLSQLGVDTDKVIAIGNPLADQFRAFAQSVGRKSAPAVTGVRAAQVHEVIARIIDMRCREQPAIQALA